MSEQDANTLDLPKNVGELEHFFASIPNGIYKCDIRDFLPIIPKGKQVIARLPDNRMIIMTPDENSIQLFDSLDINFSSI